MEKRMGWRSFAIGVACGQRSMMGPAVVRWRVRDPLRLAFAGLALGELVADKLPTTPPRTAPPALLFRMLTGGYCGRALAADGEHVVATVAGVAGAVTGAYVGMALRLGLGRITGLPDPIVAVCEDAAAIAIAVWATRSGPSVK